MEIAMKRKNPRVHNRTDNSMFLQRIMIRCRPGISCLLHTCASYKDLLGVSDTTMEDVVKKAILICIVGLITIGCSTSGPEITSTSISNDNPVTGQKILLQVYSIADKTPLTYSWICSGGEFDENTDEDMQYYRYWVAPEEAGEQTITCTVRDGNDDEETVTFSIEVNSRVIDDTLVDGNVLSILKQTGTIGGVWVSMENEDIRFISSTTNEETSYQGAFTSMLIELDTSDFTYTLWGAQGQGTGISVQSSEEETVLTCETCDTTDVINDLAIDVIDGNILWVGADSGMHWYDSAEDEWGEYKPEKTNDFYEGINFVYAATSTGIYELDPYAADSDPVYMGDSCAVIEVENDDETVNVWHITDSQVCLDGAPLASQPDSVTCSLDADWDNVIWCGKYFWDGDSWQTPPGLEGEDIVTSVVSNEGLVYLLTSSGALLRW